MEITAKLLCSFLLWNNLQTKEVFYEGYVMAVTLKYKDMKPMGWISNTVQVNGPLNFLLADLQWSLKTFKGNYESQVASSLFILKVIHIAYWSVHTSCMIPHGLTCLHCLAWNTCFTHVSDSLIADCRTFGSKICYLAGSILPSFCAVFPVSLLYNSKRNSDSESLQIASLTKLLLLHKAQGGFWLRAVLSPVWQLCALYWRPPPKKHCMIFSERPPTQM